MFRVMKISETIKSLFRRRPVTEEELANRAEAEAVREKIRLDRAREAADTAQIDRLP
jgi:hypothetical protein